VANRILRGALSKQEKIKFDTIVSYLIDLRSHHVDRGLSTEVFERSSLSLLLKDEKRMFARTKKRRLSITKAILEKITDEIILTDQIMKLKIISNELDELIISIAFKVA
jgi:hypothetical protein